MTNAIRFPLLGTMSMRTSLSLSDLNLGAGDHWDKCGTLALLCAQRLIDERVDHLPVLPADAARRLRHPYDHQLLVRVDPPVGATCARPGEIADRAHHAHNARRGAHRNPETEAVVRARRVPGHPDHI